MAGTARPSVVLVVENLPLPFDRRVWQQAQALVSDGWTVSAICPATDAYPSRYEFIDGVHIHRYRLPVEASSKLEFVLEYVSAYIHHVRLLWLIKRKTGFDIIQGCNPPDTIVLASWMFRSKYVFDHHDIAPELFDVKFGEFRPVSRLLLWLERLSYRAADHVITANETFRELCAKRNGIELADVTAVYSVPDSAHIHRVEPSEHLRSRPSPVLGYLGVVGSQDGLDHLMRAAAILHHELKREFSVAVVGDGPALPEVKALAGELGLADLVEFTGFLTGDDMLAALSSFDIGVIPDPHNPYNDKISMNKVFEYAAIGLPIVGYPLTETTRLLGDSMVAADGLDPRDLALAMDTLVVDEENRAEMGKRSLDRAERLFDWDTERSRYLGVMNGVVGRGGSDGSGAGRIEDA